MNRKEREKLTRKNEMLAAAKKLISEKGFFDTTFKEIAKEAEFSRITLYSYFKNKYDIVCHLFLNELFDFFKEIKEEIKEQKSSKDKLLYFGFKYYEFFKDNPSYHELVFILESKGIEENSLSEETQKINNAFTLFSEKILLEIFQEGIKNKELKLDIIPKIALDTYWKSVYAIIHTYVFHPKEKIERLKTELEYLTRAFTI